MQHDPSIRDKQNRASAACLEEIASPSQAAFRNRIKYWVCWVIPAYPAIISSSMRLSSTECRASPALHVVGCYGIATYPKRSEIADRSPRVELRSGTQWSTTQSSTKLWQWGHNIESHKCHRGKNNSRYKQRESSKTKETSIGKDFIRFRISWR